MPPSPLSSPSCRTTATLPLLSASDSTKLNELAVVVAAVGRWLAVGGYGGSRKSLSSEDLEREEREESGDDDDVGSIF